MLNPSQYYQNNKLWYQTWLTELQHRLLHVPEYKHITVNGVHPGFVNSGIWTINKKEGENMSWLDYIKQSVLRFVASWFGINPQQGSLAILHAATSETCGPNPEVQGVGIPGGKGGGRYFNRIWEAEVSFVFLLRLCATLGMKEWDEVKLTRNSQCRIPRIQTAE